MENKIICLDTSVLIDYFRKKNKQNTFFFQLTKKYSIFAVSVITEYEIYIGSNSEQEKFWNNFFKFLTILPVNSYVIKNAVEIEKKLKKTRKSIDIPDLFIAATTLENKMALATLNTKHFQNIEKIQLITLSSTLRT